MTFYLVALVMGLIACVFILLPLRAKRVKVPDSERKDLNVALYREHVSELGEEEDAEQLTLEAQKVLLSETMGEDSEVASSDGAKKVFLTTAVILPIFAALVYLDFGLGLGSITDVELTRQLENTNPADRTAYRRFVGEVEARAAQVPEDDDIQFLLARAYLNIEEHSAAADVMAGLVARFPEDANLLSQYAEVLYLKAGRKVDDHVAAAIDNALRVNPNDITMMEIMAIAAIEAGDPETGVSWLQRALATGISGRRADMIRSAISRFSGEGASQPGDTGRSLSVAVSRATDLELSDSAVVFVYARAASGPPAPLAVQRFPVAQLPLQITLDESMAMVPGMSLGTFDEVVVIARISQSGEVAPSPGDYEARSEVIDQTKEVATVSLEISEPISG